MTIIDIKHLKKEFKDKKDTFVAVDDVSFQMRSGQVVALLGPNGAGKTTIVQMLAGYLKQTSGTIMIDDVELTDKNRQDFPMGIVLGGELGFYGNASAKDNLTFFAHLKKVKRQQIKEEVERVLTLVQLENVKDKKVREFSKGMRQRLHIARALLNSPKIILLDEPTTGLDVEVAKTIRDTVKHLAKMEDIAFLLTSHTMSEIEFLSDKILLIGAGKIHHEGNVESIIALSKVQTIDRPATLEESYLALAEQLKRG